MIFIGFDEFKIWAFCQAEHNLTPHSHSLWLTGASWQEWPHATGDSREAPKLELQRTYKWGEKSHPHRNGNKQLAPIYFILVFAGVTKGTEQRWSSHHINYIRIKDYSLEGYDTERWDSFSTRTFPEKELTCPHTRRPSGAAGALPKATPIPSLISNMTASLPTLLLAATLPPEELLFLTCSSCAGRAGTGGRREKGEGGWEEGDRSGAVPGDTPPRRGGTSRQPRSEACKSGAAGPGSSERPAGAALRSRWAGPGGHRGPPTGTGTGSGAGDRASPHLTSPRCSAGCTSCRDRRTNEQNVVRNGSRGEGELCFSGGGGLGGGLADASSTELKSKSPAKQPAVAFRFFPLPGRN